MLPENTEAKAGPVVDLPPQGKYGFVGREVEMTRLERAFRQASIVLLTGPAGVGKTDLACEFARRLVDSGEAEGGALFISFHHGAGLPRVLHEIGTTLRGITFARLSLEEQRRWTVDYLRSNPCLLVWDDFDNAFEYLDDGEIQELVDLLREINDGREISGGAGRVLITGRGKALIDDARLPYMVECRHQALRGLSEEDAAQLAGLVLDEAGVNAADVADTAELEPEYPELARLLQGNPMAMRVVLPHLNRHTPSELSRFLRQFGQDGIGETELADAALSCSFSCLSPRARAHLPFLALFQQRVLLDVLTFMTQGEAYVSVMGEEMGWGACRTFLREARDYGILDSISPSVYLIPPAVPSFLARQLDLRLTLSQIDTLAQEFVRVYSDLGDYFLENLASEESESTVTGVLAEEANLLRALRLAETSGQWDNVQLVLQPLGQVYKMQERVLELRRLRGLVLSHIGLDADQAEQRGAIDLWMYLQATEISESIDRLEMDRAEGICYAVLKHLEASGESDAQLRVASVYHSLGLIAQGRGQYGEAEGLYRKAMRINETLGNEAGSADAYHQLGLIDQSRHRYEEAEAWHRMALEARERLEDEGESANECYQLGLLAEARYNFQDAFEWYQRARIAYEHTGDRSSEAAIYHRLGLIAQTHYDYEEAMGWYQRALLVYEELEDEVGGAADCYQIGLIALHRYEYEAAQGWLDQALEAYEMVGNESAIADTYHHLGVVAHAQKRYGEAEGWYQKALEILVRRGDEVVAANTWGQLGLLADQRRNYPHAVWYVAHIYEIAAAHQLPLLEQARKHLSGLRAKMGTEAFTRSWQEVSDVNVLPELE